MSKQIPLSKLFFLGFLGNIAEWYVFSVYIFLAVTIGEFFFSTSNPQLALLKTFSLFSASYLARPIGSIFLGYIADKFGRKKSLKISLWLMAIPTVLIGMIPSYTNIGNLATFILIILRLIQGFAAGGEYASVACYLYESAPTNKRIFFCSIATASPAIGIFLGSSIATLLYAIAPPSIIQTWGWRIPFLLGIFVLIFIFRIANNLVESQKFSQLSTKKNNTHQQPLLKKLVTYKKSFLIAIPICIFLEVSFYLLFVWMPLYLNVFLDFAIDKSFLNSSIGLLSLVIVTLLVGYFAKHTQLKKIIFLSICGVSLLAYPLFLLLQLKILAFVILTQLVFAIFLGGLCGISMFVINNLFNTEIRCLGIGISAAIANGIFGGLTPSICIYLIHKTGYTLVPVFFLISTGIIALLATLNFKDNNSLL